MSSILPTINEQYLMRNQDLLTKMLISFREVNRTYNNNLILSLDNDKWIVFDSRIGRDIYSTPFKKFIDFNNWLMCLNRDIINVEYSRVKKQSETWSLKRLQTIYKENEMSYFLNR